MVRGTPWPISSPISREIVAILSTAVLLIWMV